MSNGWDIILSALTAVVVETTRILWVFIVKWRKADLLCQ
jgi:hypothetical protein